MNRRTYLGLAAIPAVVATAGCADTLATIRKVIEEAEEAELSERVRGERETFTFEAAAGDEISIKADAESDERQGFAATTLYDPDDEPILEFENHTDRVGGMNHVEAERSGTYQLTVDPSHEDVDVVVWVFVTSDE